MNDPDVILAVNGNSNGHAEEPVIRQGLRPQGVYFEHRRLNPGSRNRSSLLQQRGAKSEQADDHEKSCALVEIASHTLSSFTEARFCFSKGIITTGANGRHYTRLEVPRFIFSICRSAK